MSKSWHQLRVAKNDLQLRPTLGGGQSFRWKIIEGDKWIGIFKKKVWILNRVSDEYLNYQCYGETLQNGGTNSFTEDDLKNEDEENRKLLREYFRLDVNLSHYYKIWSKADPHFEEAATRFYGVRILNQDVTENIFSFICSSNNNIKRISGMVEKLCTLYGNPITEIHKEMFYDFPSVKKLSSSTVESDLRKAGFGYRAKFIYQSACKIEDLGGLTWLENLKTMPYQEAKMELMKLPGVGAKVADCICLMSLGHMEAVPVDTHIFQVASEMHLPHLKKFKSCTNKIYKEIADYYRSHYGTYAGWAQTVLFCSDLKSNSSCVTLKERKRQKKTKFLETSRNKEDSF